MKKLVFTIVFAFALGLYTVSATAETLVDVPPEHWAADAVQKLIDSGVIVGYPDKTFRGPNSMTRYEYAMVVARLMTWIDQNYCATADGCGGKLPDNIATKADLDEIKKIIEKLAAEFEDELAQLRQDVDKNTVDIEDLKNKIANLPSSKFRFSGTIRQRIDVPDSDMLSTQLPTLLNTLYGYTGVSDLSAGYEMYPAIQFDDAIEGGPVEWSVRLSKVIANQAISSTNNVSDLNIEHAYVGLDFSDAVKELDLLKVTSGYQPATFGHYGALVDNRGVDSSLGVRLDVGKDIVTLTGFGGLADATGNAAASGLGTSDKDPYAAMRLSLDLSPVQIGVNYLANGLAKEKGWGVDLEAELLKDSPFLKAVYGEYLKMTDEWDGTSPAATDDDDSFIVGLDVYETKRAGLTVSYAEIPAIPGLTGVDISPLSEYDTTCPAMGLDVTPATAAGAAMCFNREDSNVIFPAGFKGVGVEASYIVLGDVELSAMAVMGDFAAGTVPAGAAYGNMAGSPAELIAYPGYGKLAVTKPITDNSKFKVEYLQQGKDPILFNRVRGELLINF